VLFILVCLIWGTSFLLMRWATESGFGPVHVAVARATCGGVFLAAVWVVRRRGWPFAWRDLGPLLLISAAGYALPYSIQPHVIHLVQQEVEHGSSFGGLIVALVPLFTVVVQAVVLRVWPTGRQWFGVIGALVLLVLLAWDELRRGVPLGVYCLAVLTPLGYATANTFVRRNFHGAPAMALSAAAMLLAGALVLPVAAAQDPVQTDHPQFPLGLTCIVVLGIVSTGLTTFLFYKLIQREGPLFAGMVGYIIPCVAMIVGAASGEKVTPGQWLTLAGVFVLVTVAQTGAGKRRAESGKRWG